MLNLYHFVVVFWSNNMPQTNVCVRSAIVFAVQIITALSLVLAAFVNLSVGKPEHHDLWLVLLSSAIGYIFPSPTLKRRKCEAETHV